jgi:hypothetical protein
MFKRIKRKLASGRHKSTRREKVYEEPLESSSDAPFKSDPWDRTLLQERGSPPQPEIVAKPDERVKRLERPENVSHFNFDSNDCGPHGPAIYPPPGPRDQELDYLQYLVRAQSNIHQQEVEDSLIGDEAAKLITLRTPARKLRALLLPPCTFQRTQALVHARQDLRAVESELATTAAELRNLIAAKSELDGQDGREVPGAFFDDDAYTERER